MNNDFSCASDLFDVLFHLFLELVSCVSHLHLLDHLYQLFFKKPQLHHGGGVVGGLEFECLELLLALLLLLGPEQLPPHATKELLYPSCQHLLVGELGHKGDVLQGVIDVQVAGGVHHQVDDQDKKTLTPSVSLVISKWLILTKKRSQL